ncbi:MAG: hypothetical protein HFJ42_02210 [Clostridia bacterium]|nr:hypothetical protein [Clostridia bacterium]
MTFQEKIELLNNLKNDYYYGTNNCDLEKLKNEFDELHLSDEDFIHDEDHEHGQLFICPDIEGEFPKVYEIAGENMKRAIDVIYDAIVLYYKESDFWDEITDLTSDEVVRLYTKLNNIPIIRFFSTSNVELLNLKKLNRDVR